MSISMIESILQSANLTEIIRPFLDVTYLLAVFLSVFLATLSIESVKSITGMSIKKR